MFKKISEARNLFASLADCAHVKANHCAHGPNNCQQNCLCHLNIVIWAQIQTWNLSILVHLRIISDLTHLLLDHVLYNTLFEFFRFTKKYVSPVVLTPPPTSSLQILCSLFPTMSRGRADRRALSTNVQKHNFSCIQWKEICGWRISSNYIKSKSVFIEKFVKYWIWETALSVWNEVIFKDCEPLLSMTWGRCLPRSVMRRNAGDYQSEDRLESGLRLNRLWAMFRITVSSTNKRTIFKQPLWSLKAEVDHFVLFSLSWAGGAWCNVGSEHHLFPISYLSNLALC